MARALAAGISVPCGLVALHAANESGPSRAEARAIEYLQREVPAWHRENGCFSCHNNGDAARALYVAKGHGYRISAETLQQTTAWLAKPASWDDNKGDPGFNDKRLANLQFGIALLEAFDAGVTDDRAALDEAARRIVADQNIDGSWPIDAGNAVGSPGTYGTTLATTIALHILRRASPAAAAEEALRKTRTWLQRQESASMAGTAALLLASSIAFDPADENRERKRDGWLERLRRSQTRDGGWGPYADAPPEIFDSALVLVALSRVNDHDNVSAMIARGRAFLAAQQERDGHWRATTRPPGGDSYAQTISTTAWAALALLATRP